MMTRLRILTGLFASTMAVASAAAQEPASVSDAVTAAAVTGANGSGFVITPVALAAAGGLEQVGKPAGPPPTPEHTGIKATAREFLIDFKHLPSRENLLWVGIGSGVALAVHPADTSFNAHVSGDGWDKFFAVGTVVGNSATLFSVSTAVYVVGRASDNKRVSHVGSDLLQALGVAEVIVQSLKYTTRRERPDGSGATSFPSGHAADTFAFATALERHLGWKGAVPAYLFSTYVAMSRLNDNRHYLSDVAFGSAVGIIAGRTVTRHGRGSYSYAVAPVAGGAMLTFTRLPKITAKADRDETANPARLTIGGGVQ
jgi:membrane-associated phospholipid phosphatase